MYPPTHTHMPLVESNRRATGPTPTHCPATHTHTHLHSGCVVVRYVWRDHCACVYVCVRVCVLIGLCAWVRVCVWVCIHGSVVVCVDVWVLV